MRNVTGGRLLVKKKHMQWLFLVFSIGCLLPYFIPALNQLEPRIFGIPFTVWSVNLWMLLCCGLLKWLSLNVWDTYDGDGSGDSGKEA